MQKISEESWPNFELECLNLVHKFRQPAAQPPWQTQHQPASWQSSHQWSANSPWSLSIQRPTANQSCYNPVIPAAPSAVPLHGPSPSHHPPVTASAMTSSTRRSNELVSVVFEEGE